MENRDPGADPRRLLSAEDLLAGADQLYDVVVPAELLAPGGLPGRVRMRPLSVALLLLIARAARDDAGLASLLTLKETLVEPRLSLDQIRALPAGMACFLVERANALSGLTADHEAIADAGESPLGQVHVLLARHFGWTPEQTARLTPGQIAVYLAGLERLRAREEVDDGAPLR